jgi:hypothetical protein
MIAELILSLSLILPGLWILEIMKIRLDSMIEQITLSYIFSLVVMFGLLYLGALSYSFNVTSFIYLILVIVSFLYLILSFIYRKLYISFRQFVHTSSIISIEKFILIISTATMHSFYVIYLYEKAILDSDVVQYYLPIAREIVRQNGFPYFTGYDYNIFLKPIGGSVIYAWTYVVSGSMLTEYFRLMPLVPLLILTILNYAIATSASNSEKIGLLSTLLYLVLPFHDRFLLYNSFYPDIFYYPLIFSVIYFFIKYSYSRRSELLIWIGMSLGCAALLKAQTVYFVITILVMFFILQLKTFKKLSMMFCAIAPFLILIPDFLASSVQRGGIRISVPLLTETQLLLFLSFLCIISYYVTLFRIRENTKVGKPSLKEVIKESMLLFLPFILLTSLWYVANLFRFGTLLYTSSINLPNYDWALKILQNLSSVKPLSSPWHYILIYMFMFIDPAVMGYAMLIPLLIGMASMLISKNKFESFNLLFLFEIISSSIIFSAVIITQSVVYNPRDIFPLTPLLTSSVATGIAFASLNYRARSNKTAEIFMPLLLIIYFGFLAYIHSVLVYYTSNNYSYSSVTVTLLSFLVNMVGLNLRQTSFQLSYYERIVFLSENFNKIILLSVITGLPVIILLGYRLIILRVRALRFKFNIRIASEKILFKPHLLIDTRLIRYGLILILLLSTLLIPRIELIIAYGGLSELRKNQLKNSYGSLYMLLESSIDFRGGILTFEGPDGLPYYMPNSKVIDLRYPANLAFLKDCLLSGDSYEIIIKLKSLGINHILINPSNMRFKTLDESLNFSISSLIGNPELVLLSKSFGNWKLYTLGPYEVDKIRLPLGGWSVDSRSTLTNAQYVFTTNETGIFLVLYPTDINSRVTIFTKTIPKLNLSDYDYVIVRLKGSNNARILVRFFTSDGSSFDVAYWQDPYTLMTALFDLRQYTGKILNGYLLVALKSLDGLPSSLYLYEISFIKIKR